VASKQRDYKQERKTAIARGETGVGSKSGDATRHRDRRKLERTSGKKVPNGKEVHHEGKGAKGKTKVISKAKNRSMGGKIGSKAGKAIGGRKGGKASSSSSKKKK